MHLSSYLKMEWFKNNYWQGEGRRKAVARGTGTLAAKLWNRIPCLDIVPVAYVDNDKVKCGRFSVGSGWQHLRKSVRWIMI